MRRIFSTIAVLSALAAVPGGALADQATPDELRLSRADCARLVMHQPAPDVTYQPGVDATGRPVAPADLNGGTPRIVPDEIVIPLEMNVLRGRRWSQALDAEAALGTIVVRDGKAWFNGEPLHGWEQEVLADACRKLGVR